ncbi:MAG: hypothetical protein ACREN5_05120 [Gemmatimonadales bacterium]
MFRVFGSLALISLTAGAALGQVPAATGSVAPMALDRINGQVLIRVRGDWGVAYLREPRLVRDTLSYTSAPSAPPSLPQPLTLEALQRVEVRENAAGMGATIGAGVGFALGLAAGLGLTSSLCDSGWGSCTNAGGGVALVTLGSTVGGALIGALIGGVNQRWRTVYRRP